MSTNGAVHKNGTFYGIGIGPGDPELMTLKAERILRQVPVICVPKGKENGASYAYSIVSHLADPERQEVLPLLFPMTRDQAVREAHWSANVREIVTRLQSGRDVAFVTEGDPFIYSTFIDLHRLVREGHPELRIEVIPGISSINAAAVAIDAPLVDGEERFAVLPATYTHEELTDVLRTFDTVVLLKVNRCFDRVLDALEALDLVDRAVFIRRCSSAEQEIIPDLRSLRGQQLDYLSLVIVRK